MKSACRAEDVFKDFPDDLKSKIFAAAEGKLIYFPKNQKKKQIVNQEDALIKYAQNSKKSCKQIGDELGISKVRVFQIVYQERKRFSKERVEYWKRQGLSLREIALLYEKSHERIRQIQKEHR
jgi:DNA-directed RNA polymerase sigma subunit (sigma70/sigma32)